MAQFERTIKLEKTLQLGNAVTEMSHLLRKQTLLGIAIAALSTTSHYGMVVNSYLLVNLSSDEKSPSVDSSCAHIWARLPLVTIQKVDKQLEKEMDLAAERFVTPAFPTFGTSIGESDSSGSLLGGEGAITFDQE